MISAPSSPNWTPCKARRVSIRNTETTHGHEYRIRDTGCDQRRGTNVICRQLTGATSAGARAGKRQQRKGSPTCLEQSQKKKEKNIKMMEIAKHLVFSSGWLKEGDLGFPTCGPGPTGGPGRHCNWAKKIRNRRITTAIDGGMMNMEGYEVAMDYLDNSCCIQSVIWLNAFWQIQDSGRVNSPEEAAILELPYFPTRLIHSLGYFCSSCWKLHKEAVNKLTGAIENDLA